MVKRENKRLRFLQVGNLNSLKIRMSILSIKTQLFFLKLKKRRAIAPLIIVGAGVALKVIDIMLDKRKKKK